MTAVSLPRGQITSHIVGELLDSFPFPVGDNDAPTTPYAWQGEPNADGSNFIPWISIGTGTSTRSTGSLATSQSDWQANYFVTSAGVARKQTDQTADLARDFLVKLERQKIITTNGTWKLQQARVTSIGGIQRMNPARPHYFVQTDVIEFWLSREIS